MTSSPSQLPELLADAVAEPPATSVTAADTYRRGRRRRGIVRASAVCAAVAAVAVVGVGVSELRPEADAVPPAVPRVGLDPLPETPARCADLAEAVKTVGEATLPAEITWTGTRLNEGAENCDGGGLFWVTFTYLGDEHTLGFEGGEMEGKACDAERCVVDCEDGGTYRVGHYNSDQEYGVLYGRTGLFFYLGLQDGVDPPVTTDELATVAKEIDRVVFRG